MGETPSMHEGFEDQVLTINIARVQTPAVGPPLSDCQMQAAGP